MAGRRVPWVLIIVLVLAGMVAAVIGAGAFAYFRYVGVRTADVKEAERSFEDVLARFKDQEPRLVMDDHHHVRLKKPLGSDVTPTSFTGLHVLVWDDDEGKLVKVEIPAWLLRMRGDTTDFDVTLDSGETVKIDVKELERMGPGLLLDHKEGPNRVVVWIE